MVKVKTPLHKPNWLKNPWPWGMAYACLILFSHCSEFDPNETALSSFGKVTTTLESSLARRAPHQLTAPVVPQSAQKTIDRLRMIQEPSVTPELPTVSTAFMQPMQPAQPVGPLKRTLYSALDILGLRQDWRLFQSPHPEVQGFEVRAYHRTITPGGSLYHPAYVRCQDLDDNGVCSPDVGGRMELELLRKIEKLRSLQLMKAFSQHVASRLSKSIHKDFKKIEFVVYRHAFKLSKDFSKRGSAQILYSEAL